MLKISLPLESLREALQGLAKVVAARSTLPVLSHIRTDADGSVQLTGTDLERSVTFTAESKEAVQAAGSVLLPLDGLRSLLKSCRKGLIEIEQAADTEVHVTVEDGGHRLSRRFVVPEVAEWPELPNAPKTEAVDPAFLAHIRRALVSASTDETRPILCAVLLDVSEPTRHQIVATDGRRLTASNGLQLPLGKSVIVPASRFLAWPQLSGEVRIGCDKEAAYFSLQAGPWAYVCRTIEGTYPNWRMVVPAPMDGERTLRVDGEDAAMLARTLPGLVKASGPSACVRLDLSPRGCGIRTQTADGESIVLLPRSRYEGPAMTLGLNGGFVADALAAGFRCFDLTDDLSPVVGRPSEKDRSAVLVIMPMRIADSRPAPVSEEEAEDQAGSQPAEQQVSEPEVQPQTDKEPTMPKPETTQPTADPFERLATACDALKNALREANAAASEISAAAREAAREEKGRRKEVESVRSLIDKVSALKAA